MMSLPSPSANFKNHAMEIEAEPHAENVQINFKKSPSSQRSHPGVSRPMLVFAGLGCVLVVGLLAYFGYHSATKKDEVTSAHVEAASCVDPWDSEGKLQLLKDQYPDASVYNLILTSGNGSALNAATNGAINRDINNPVDGTEILINGQFPGPVIKAKKNQLLIVRVVNAMESSTVSMHWHGIVQKDTPYMDGTSMVSQCPIGPNGKEFLYVMNTTDTGTFMYHGHIRMTPVNLYGAIIVEEEEEKAEFPNWTEEMDDSHRVLLLSDAWLENSKNQLEGIQKKDGQFKWIGNPQVLLVNGRTSPLNCTVDTCDHPILYIKDVKRTNSLVRVVNAATLGYLSVTIEKHHFIVLRADLRYVEPFETKILEVNSGQRYDVVIMRDDDDVDEEEGADESGENDEEPEVYSYGSDQGQIVQEQTQFWMRIKMEGRADGTESWSVLAYDYDNTQEQNPLWKQPVPTNANDFVPEPVLEFGGMENKLIPFDTEEMSPEADVEVILEARQENVTEFNQTFWYMNGQPRSVPMDYPLLHYVEQMDQQLQKGASYEDVQQWLEEDIEEEKRRPLVFRRNQVVQFVIQGTVATNGVCEQHPMHLHLGEFYVVGYGPGKYEPNSIGLDETKTKVLKRDTITLFPSNHTFSDPIKGKPGDPCGWVAIRAFFENAGASVLHCHIATHMAMGMAMYMLILPDEGEKLPTPMDLGKLSDSFTTNLATDCPAYLAGVHDGIDTK